MNDEKEPGKATAAAAPNTSESIDVPKEKPPGAWEMPEPVFQQSSGYLPQGFEKRFPIPDPQADVPTDEPVAEVPVAAADGSLPPAPPDISESPDIQPQPDVTEDFRIDELTAPPAAAKKQRSPAIRILLALLGILGMVLLAAVFLAVIYWLFFYQPSDPQVLN